MPKISRTILDKEKIMELTLYSRYRNSAGQRVRTALNIKGVDYDYIAVGDTGSISKQDYLSINPQGLLPTLIINGERVTQSTALVEFIEENFEGPSLLPEDPVARARSRAFGQVIACEMHAVGVGRMRRDLADERGLTKDEVRRWYEHWLHHGYQTLEELMRQRSVATPFCYDDKPTIGDLYLVPQLYNSRLFEIDLSSYPMLTTIDEHCRALPEFAKAMPQNQPDYPEKPEGYR
jgi:maleylacetoacetate isomerase